MAKATKKVVKRRRERKVVAELLLQNAVNKLHLLLLFQLQCVLRLLLAHIGVGIAGSGFLSVAHDCRRNAQSLATLSDRLHILSHILLILLVPITRDDAWGDGSHCEEWGSRP